MAIIIDVDLHRYIAVLRINRGGKDLCVDVIDPQVLGKELHVCSKWLNACDCSARIPAGEVEGRQSYIGSKIKNRGRRLIEWEAIMFLLEYLTVNEGVGATICAHAKSYFAYGLGVTKPNRKLTPGKAQFGTVCPREPINEIPPIRTTTPGCCDVSDKPSRIHCSPFYDPGARSLCLQSRRQPSRAKSTRSPSLDVQPRKDRLSSVPQ